MPDTISQQVQGPPDQRSVVRRLGGTAYWRSRRVVRKLRARALDLVAPPKVSVVVPVYNVERYLLACLNSIVKQTFDDLEIIIVDDGSTDGSAAIAREFQRTHRRRVKYVRQPNAGLGAARNTGVKHVRGKYLMFVDSDDTLPKRAVQAMVRTIEATGSDFVCGAPQRVEDGVKRIPRWVTKLHGEADLRTTIWQRPDMILDVFAWNKLWSMEFWRSADMIFPVGLFYEDQIPSANAYLASTSFDVIPDIVYNWYTRTGASSITQSTAELRNLRDRVTVTQMVNNLLIERANPEIRRSWLDNRILGNDLSLYLKDVDWVTEEYYDEIKRWLSGLFTESDWLADYDAPPMKRLLAWAVVHRDRHTVEVLRALERSNQGGLPTRITASSVYVTLGDLDPELLSGAPEGLFRIIDSSLELNSNLRTLRWTAPRVLELTGWAFIRNLNLAENQTDVMVQLRGADGEVLLEAPTRPAPELRVTRRGMNRWTSYDASAFRARLDLADLVRDDEGVPPELSVHVRVRTAGFERSGPLRPPTANGGVKWPVASPVRDGWKVEPRWAGDILRLVPKAVPLLVSEVAAHGDDVVLDVTSEQDLERVFVLQRSQSERRTLEAAISAQGGDRYRITFSGLGAFLLQGGQNQLRAETGSGRTTVAMDERLPDVTDLGNGVGTRRSASQNLQLVVSRARVYVDSDTVEGTRWRLSGTAFHTDLEELVLAGPRYRLSPLEATTSESGRFELTFDLRAAEWGEAPRPVPPGFYHLRHDAPAVGHPVIGDQPTLIRWSTQGLRNVPREFIDARYSVRSGKDLTPALEVLPDIGGDGVGAYYQHELQRKVYQPARHSARVPSVLFESFHGRNATDNPLSIYQELVSRGTDLEMYWSVNDSSVWSPPGATKLIRNSAEWYEVLGSARYLVNNSNWPSAFRQADHQLYLQTWHGTPLKRIGHDIQRVLFSYRNYLEMMDREASGWDALISPNRFCSELFPHAFAYDGKMLETGYPRNDALVNAPAEGAARARRLLGLEHDTRAILLYAPTWRDDKFVGAPGRYQAVYHLDFEEFAAARGDDYLVLVRGHSNTLLYGRKVQGDSVIDVSRYPEIADLYALADVLVTDYSSVMFDYSVTAKPMLFLAPDIADYRDRVRGFYFDFEATSPGPILTTTRELLDRLSDLDALAADYAQPYAEFRRRFNALEDGRAAERVVDAFFGLTAVHGRKQDVDRSTQPGGSPHAAG